jgi:hypothetical protein
MEQCWGLQALGSLWLVCFGPHVLSHERSSVLQSLPTILGYCEEETERWIPRGLAGERIIDCFPYCTTETISLRRLSPP